MKEEVKSQVLFAPLRLLVRQLVRRSALAKADALKPHAWRDRLELPAVGRGKLRPMAVITGEYR
jgi:hypothetical protein